MPLQRKQRWATRHLHGFLLDHAHRPFVWGKHDCALFAANAILAVTGTDIAAEFRGKYHDEASAFTLIQHVTGKGSNPKTAVADAAAWCAERHGLVERQNPLMAQRGDLVVMEDAGRLISGVIHLNGRHAVTVGADGLKRISITNVKRAWAV